MKSKIPKHFPPEMANWFDYYTTEFQMDPADRCILEMLGDTWMEYQGLRLELETAESYTFLDRFGSPKPRPELAAMNTLKITYARLRRELNLPIDEPEESRLPRSGRVA